MTEDLSTSAEPKCRELGVILYPTFSAKAFILKIVCDIILQLYVKDMLDGSFLTYTLGQISVKILFIL